MPRKNEPAGPIPIYTLIRRCPACNSAQIEARDIPDPDRQALLVGILTEGQVVRCQRCGRSRPTFELGWAWQAQNEAAWEDQTR